MTLPTSARSVPAEQAARRIVAGLTAVALVASACGRLYEYPDPEAENTLEACSDDKDNDLDGKADCDDTDCVLCAEGSERTCHDERDNDGDGLTDVADPRCWLLQAPAVERCAEASGVEIFDNFDARSLGSWTFQANGWTFVYVHESLDRQDPLIYFGGDGPESNLSAFIRRRPFSGSWQDFELSFSASIPLSTLLRVAIVPLALAPSQEYPMPGAEFALLGLTLDAMGSPPTLALDVEGRHFSKPLPDSGAACREALCRVTVVLDPVGVRASLAHPDGSTTELLAEPPASSSLPAARVVFWGGSKSSSRGALLDDLRLNIKPEWPCGFAAPQVPGKGCEFSDELAAFGHGVSVARNAQGEYCALVAASKALDAAPHTLTAWRSPEGETWTAASSVEDPPVELQEGATLVGASIAADRDGWHTAVAYRKDGKVRLGFADGESCHRFGELSEERVLFEDLGDGEGDAEAPSYVIDKGQHDVYFTRRPEGDGQRTLWHVARHAAGTPPELLARLPPGVAQPVSVQLVGSSDLVLTYPSPVGPGNNGGVGILVGDPGLRSWRQVEPDPVLELGSRADLSPGERLAFDDEGVVAAALAWHQTGGFLLYAGTSASGIPDATTSQPPERVLSVGTARLAPAGATAPRAAVVAVPTCGDGRCSVNESCTSCGEDCECAGVVVLHDVFGDDEPWTVVSDDQYPKAIRYLSADPPALNWVGGEPTWSVLPLEHPLNGDFELSFDARVAYTDRTDKICSVFVGLGTAPDLMGVQSIGIPATPAGIFARFNIDLSCRDRFHRTPFVLTQNSKRAPPEDSSLCQDEQALAMDAWQHVVLRREGSTVTIATPRADGCGMFETAVTYAGALPDLSAVLVGFGGGAFDDCASGQYDPSIGVARVRHGAVKNLMLRLPEDPGECPDGKELCGTLPTQPSCIDVSSSAEHCGACNRRCSANESCRDGVCTCSELPGILECDGACVDSSSSSLHCGRCGNPCMGACVRGACALVGECPAPLEIDAEGGTLLLDFAPGDGVATVCAQALFNPTLIAWTPAQSGFAVIEVDVGGTSLDTMVGLANEASCTDWVVCNDDAPSLGAGSRLRAWVEGGTTYFIGVGLLRAPPMPETAFLRIGVEQ